MKQEPQSLSLSEGLKTALSGELAKSPYKEMDPDLAYLAAAQALLQREKDEEVAIFDLSNPGDRLAMELAAMD